MRDRKRMNGGLATDIGVGWLLWMVAATILVSCTDGHSAPKESSVPALAGGHADVTGTLTSSERHHQDPQDPKDAIGIAQLARTAEATADANAHGSPATLCNGTRTRECEPGTTRCDPNSNGVETCSSSGRWTYVVACNNQACLSGATGAPDPRACRGGTQLLSGHAPVGIDNLRMVAPLPSSTRLTLGIALPLTNRAALENLIAELGNPGSPQFRRYLTPAQFGDSFGASQSDYRRLISFVQSSGLSVTRSYAGRNMLEVTGTAAAIERMLFVPLNVYERHNGTFFYAPPFDPSINLDVPIRFITGLDNFAVPKRAATELNCDVGPSHEYSYGPTDLRNIYLPCIADSTSPIDGSGQTIGLLEGGSYYPNDIADYAALFGMAPPKITNVQVPTSAAIPPLPPLDGGSCSNAFPGVGCLASPTLPIPENPSNFFGSGFINNLLGLTPGGPWSASEDAQNEREVALDIEMALALAPGATIRVYLQDPAAYHPDLILGEMADDDIAQQISSSWVWYDAVPHPDLADIFEQFAVQGQSAFQASGDGGAYPVPQSYVNDPIIDSPYMTLVGGTNLSTGAAITPMTYSSETTWKDVTAGDASGGGFVTGYSFTLSGILIERNTLPIPAYQIGVNPQNPEVFSNPQQARMSPDVSMVAQGLFVDRGAISCSTLNCAAPGTYLVNAPVEACSGGTSASAPLWASVAALVNQQSAIGNIGFANEQLYALAAAGPTSYSLNFHDIADDSNNNLAASQSSQPNSVGNATPGYDLATGLGSPTCALLTTLSTTCVPGTTRCTSETQEETCTASGQWGAPTTCADVCAGTSCGGVCVPAATRCDPNSNGLDTCNDVGQWGDAVPCGSCQSCISGACQVTQVGACDTGQPGPCSAGTWQCLTDALTCVPLVSPAPEVCDGIDNDCDGVVDDVPAVACGSCGGTQQCGPCSIPTPSDFGDQKSIVTTVSVPGFSFTDEIKDFPTDAGWQLVSCPETIDGNVEAIARSGPNGECEYEILSGELGFGGGTVTVTVVEKRVCDPSP
jgi:hypothetical protein